MKDKKKYVKPVITKIDLNKRPDIKRIINKLQKELNDRH